MFRTQCFHCHGLDSVLGWGTEIPQAASPKIKNEQNKIYIDIFKFILYFYFIYSFGCAGS